MQIRFSLFIINLYYIQLKNTDWQPTNKYKHLTAVHARDTRNLNLDFQRLIFSSRPQRCIRPHITTAAVMITAGGFKEIMGSIIEAVRKVVATRRHSKSAAVWHRSVDNYPTSPQTTTTPWWQIGWTAGRFQRNTAEIMTATKTKQK